MELLASCDQGSESAFEELYLLCSAQLFGVLMRILSIEAVAEEALQDSFVKIWQKAGSFRPESGAPMAWMCSIARHQALDLLRRRSTREGHERADPLGLIEQTPDQAKPLYEMSDDASILMQCLEKLNKEVSECLVRAYCEGYSYEELAHRNGAPLGTVKSWIRRGLISLRECVDELS
jgi:RNA polymerase sigma-70 factor (ECF subfamily)